MCREEDPQEMALWSQTDQGTSGNTDFPSFDPLLTHQPLAPAAVEVLPASPRGGSDTLAGTLQSNQ